MPDAVSLVRSRRKRGSEQRRARERSWRMGGMGLGVIVSMVIAVLILGIGFGYASLTADLPNIDLLPILLNPPDGLLLQPTRLYDRGGTHLLATLAPTDG